MSVRIRVRRASVAMGDDSRAPHEKWVEVPAGCSHEQLVDLTSHHYLASIQGGHATWVAWLSEDPDSLGRPIAVVAQQWTTPRVVTPEASIEAGQEYLYFAYLAQRDPLEILQRVLTGRPMID